MEIGQLYQFVLLIVLVGMLLGIGLVVLNNFSTATGVAGTPAAVGINDTMDALATIPSTWLPLVVVVAMLAIVLVLVLRSFGGAGGRK